MALSDLVEWVQGVPESVAEMRPMAESICSAFTNTAKRLLELGLGYLSLDRSAATLDRESGSGCSLPAPFATGPRAFFT